MLAVYFVNEVFSYINLIINFISVYNQQRQAGGVGIGGVGRLDELSDAKEITEKWIEEG